MPIVPRPSAEVDIDSALLGELLDEQFPTLASLPRTFVAEGWDNVLWRLGRDLVARLPRRAVAAELVEREQIWLPELAPRLPITVPVPLYRGAPSVGYPWPWSICRWTPGRTAADLPPGPDAAGQLGGFLRALHQPAPPEAPPNPWRGVPLHARDERTRDSLTTLAGHVDVPALARAWQEALDVLPWDLPPVWLHGDLHPLNVVVDDNPTTGGPAILSVIDWGDLTSGDPACDLAIGWGLFDPARRAEFRRDAGCDGPTWARARGWALALGVVYLANSADHPQRGVIGTTMLDAVLAEG